jgi:hypothetical protein
MPRPSKASTITHAVESLVHSLTSLMTNLATTVKGTPSAAGGMDGFGIRKAGERGPGKGNPKLKSALKRSWANYTPRQRKARIAAMLKGRGLKPKP